MFSYLYVTYSEQPCLKQIIYTRPTKSAKTCLKSYNLLYSSNQYNN